jgi:adrenodoxin-NADP+ reductase
MMDAYAVADTIISDIVPSADGVTINSAASVPATGTVSESGELLNPRPDLDALPAEIIRGIRDGMVTQYNDWKVIGAEEVRRGESLGKERERMGWEEAQSFLTLSRERS